MEKIRHLQSWEEFETALSDLRRSAPRPADLLFRGQADASKSLSTTLERDVKNSLTIFEYYRSSYIAKPQIEAFTGIKWEAPDLKEINNFCTTYDALSLKQLPAYPYLAYLRHYGFPSPLLDWSESPYVAAYFAFRRSSPTGHAIYAYSEMGKAGKSRDGGQSEIYGLGPTISAHKRHFLQKSQYTICVQFEHDSEKGAEWRFANHDGVFYRDEPEQDILTKFVIQESERARVLKKLDDYNLNALSLFGSEESLMETMAARLFNFETGFAEA